jgi:c-di-GMP-binding flagellar brake protein YcgR
MDVKIIVETKSQMQQLIDQLSSLTDQTPRTDESRRGRWRLMYAAPGMIDLGDSLSTKEPVYITTRDISPDGMGFLSREELPNGQKLTLYLDTDLGQVEITGVVVHCTPTVGMYKIGIQFDLFEPQTN